MSGTCLFCRIVAGEIPSRRIYEDDHAVAFLDIAPWHRGHSLVVPRTHSDDLFSNAETLTAIAPAVTATGILLRSRLGADGINVLVNTGAVAGQEVFHTHVHVIPRYGSAPGLRGLVTTNEPGDLDAVLAQVTRPG